MGKLLEQGIQKAKQFYIEQLIKNGIYQPKDKELYSMTISDLKNVYQREAVPNLKRMVH